MAPAKKAKKSARPKKSRPDIFQRAYDTATGVVQKSVDIAEKKFEEVLKNVQKRAFYALVLLLAVVFLLIALGEFLSEIFPWYRRTGGYLIFAVRLFIIGQFYRKGME